VDVLLVDDDQPLLEAVADLLAEAGLDVVATASGEAALSLPEHEQEPCLLLTDWDLGPGMPGDALACKAQRRWPGVAVILMSGDQQPFRAQTSRGVFLAKPFSRKELLTTVNKVLSDRVH
jgi:DNA-binding NtrC family response regulator